jgi:hypothetical protein
MAEGFVLDHGDNGAVHVSVWQSGAPQKSFWVGTKQVKADQKPVSTLRCDRCGYLESYAI